MYVRNAQSDIIKLVDKTGAVVVEYSYDAWGKLMAVTGSLASTLRLDNPYRYRGYRYDAETGLYYLQSRYYNPEVGRFLNADGMASTGMGLIGASMFAYCNNNPVNRYDPSGYRYFEFEPYNNNESVYSPQYEDTSFINDFKVEKGHYALYDNYRNCTNGVFHETLLDVKVEGPKFDLNNLQIGLISEDVTIITGGWEYKYVDLSLLDFGKGTLYAGSGEIF